MLAGILVGNPFGYHYEMFSNTGSIKEMIPRIARTKDIRHIHVAAHGDEQAIYGPGEQKISRTVLANALRDIDARQLYGVFLGSCKFGWSIERLMEQSGVTWVAGYVERVDWLHSSVMDAFFWHAYYLSGVSSPARKEERADNMLALLTALWIRVPYLFKELGFRASVATGSGYVTYPDDFMDDDGEPRREYRELFSVVLDFINDNEPGSWPTVT